MFVQFTAFFSEKTVNVCPLTILKDIVDVNSTYCQAVNGFLRFIAIFIAVSAFDNGIFYYHF